jgi:hypothetical protein
MKIQKKVESVMVSLLDQTVNAPTVDDQVGITRAILHLAQALVTLQSAPCDQECGRTDESTVGNVGGGGN